MAKTVRLKSSREAESRKLDIAQRYIEEGGATGGGRIGIKKARHSLENHSVPMFQRVTKPRAKTKLKKGRRRTPPSKPAR